MSCGGPIDEQNGHATIRVVKSNTIPAEVESLVDVVASTFCPMTIERIQTDKQTQHIPPPEVYMKPDQMSFSNTVEEFLEEACCIP